MKAPLYLATFNAHKADEIQKMLAPYSLAVKNLSGLNGYKAPEETGLTFLENAQIKAQSLYNILQTLDKPFSALLADDSGLECLDLKGAPGVHSSRFSGDNATDNQNNQKLIEELAQVPHPTYRARFMCCLYVLYQNGNTHHFIGTLDGHITLKPQGTQGFGYDPYFIPLHHTQTLAELSSDEKNKISHRGQAFDQWLASLASHPL